MVLNLFNQNRLTAVVTLLTDEDIDNFFKSFAERGEGESEDESNAGDVVREERVDVEDELVLPEETPVEQEPVQEETTEEPLNQSCLKLTTMATISSNSHFN